MSVQGTINKRMMEARSVEVALPGLAFGGPGGAAPPPQTAKH